MKYEHSSSSPLFERHSPMIRKPRMVYKSYTSKTTQGPFLPLLSTLLPNMQDRHNKRTVCLCTKDHCFLHVQKRQRSILYQFLLPSSGILVHSDGYRTAITALLVVKNFITLWCLLCTRHCSRSSKLLLGPHSKCFRLCRTEGLCCDYGP